MSTDGPEFLNKESSQKGENMDSDIRQPETSPLVDAARHRREQIKKLEARLQRAKARDNTATRKERDRQLYIFGAMVEGIYRTGTDHERRQIREWAARRLADQHIQRAECGFARIDEERASQTPPAPQSEA